MIVVDANVIAYFVVQGELTPLAELILEKDTDWNAPRLWHSEILNVLSGYIRKDLLSVEGALSALKIARSIVKGEVSTNEALVLELIRDSQCSSYDCEYIAAAETLRVPLVTADKQLLRSFPDVAISMRDFVTS